MEKFKMWIDGKLVDAASGKTYSVVNPATEEKIAEVPLGDRKDVQAAIAAAKKAFPIWSKKTQSERCRVMTQIATAIRKNAQEIARLERIDHGTPVMLANGQPEGGAQLFDWIAQVSESMLTGEVVQADDGTFSYIKREPVGVSAIITPWNFPFLMVCMKMSIALGTGNTCIVKPPSIDSLAALKLAEVMSELDIPQGTVNFVTGPGSIVGEELAAHPDVNLVAFTGSCETGKRIMELASRNVKRIQLELGGKNPVIVLEDADVDAAIGKCVFGQYMNTGMVCASPGRFYVHKNRYDEFVEKFVAGSKNVVTGDPADEKTTMGPVVSAEHRDRVEGFIKSGIEQGAKLVLGGQRPTAPPLNKGYYVLPTVFTHVKQSMTIAREEIFGPVACIMEPFSTAEEAIRLANDNTFGLSAGIYSADMNNLIRYANDLQAGTVWLNDIMSVGGGLPWGGFKESGVGKEGSKYGLEEYTQRKVVAAALKRN
ncbi:MAG: aldehyde dehydrogenase [Dehalococcoidales bacterium]|nr:aldehyde dehydrogenase [Dehalococcoidales bacterium]